MRSLVIGVFLEEASVCLPRKKKQLQSRLCPLNTSDSGYVGSPLLPLLGWMYLHWRVCVCATEGVGRLKDRAKVRETGQQKATERGRIGDKEKTMKCLTDGVSLFSCQAQFKPLKSFFFLVFLYTFQPCLKL